jgi:predicted RNA binding protein YcfA (HicA-like mRNA interferase family)
MGIAGVPHLRAVRALERAGFRVVRQGKHIVMTDGKRVVTIPRHNPVKRKYHGCYCARGRPLAGGIPQVALIP